MNQKSTGPLFAGIGWEVLRGFSALWLWVAGKWRAAKREEGEKEEEEQGAGTGRRVWASTSREELRLSHAATAIYYSCCTETEGGWRTGAERARVRA